jgi:hypothetical protein
MASLIERASSSFSAICSRPGAPRDGARDARGDAVVAGNHWMEHTGRIARRVLRNERVPLQRRNAPAASGQPLDHRASRQTGADHDRMPLVGRERSDR